MQISLIVAMAENGVIGKDNKMPWHLSADLQNFKKITMGKPVVMGRKTYESIGRPLPGRQNIIVSRNPDYQQPGCLVINQLEQVKSLCSNQHEEIMIIGGSALYAGFLPIAERLYITYIHKAFNGDTYFPALELQQWKEVERIDIDKDQQVDFAYSFVTLQKIA